jgi:hydroxypyruvate isomerase
LLAHNTFVNNLRYAAEKLSVAGVRLLIEPINTFDIPGFFLSTSKQALDIIREVGFGDIFLQYDIYHMQRMEGELIQTIKNNLDVIKHIQVADNPGRFEPGTGEINFKNLFIQLDEMFYEGWIGCEYKPQNTTLAGLAWRAEHNVR